MLQHPRLCAPGRPIRHKPSSKLTRNMRVMSHSAPFPTVPSVLVYNGPGAGSRSVLSAVEAIKAHVAGNLQVRCINTRELLSGDWRDSCKLLVVPGGADLPYCAHLNGAGNQIISDYVHRGGAYLGLCAGAYYACSYIEFDLAGPLEVVGERELRFFAGIAKGPAYRGFDYSTERGAAAAVLQLSRAALEAPSSSFLAAPAMQPVPLPAAGAAAASSPAAAPAGPAGPVAAAEAEAKATQGPPQHQDPPTLSAGTPNLQLLSSAQPTVQQLQQQQPQQQGAAAAAAAAGPDFFDYCNGGPIFLAPDGSRDLGSMPGVQVLATYTDLQGAAAALRIQVGSGVAVLCGTHPELAPSWLSSSTNSSDVVKRAAAAAAAAAAASSKPDSIVAGVMGGAAAKPDGVAVQVVIEQQSTGSSDVEAAATAVHARNLHSALVLTKESRTLFWRATLAHALQAADQRA